MVVLSQRVLVGAWGLEKLVFCILRICGFQTCLLLFPPTGAIELVFKWIGQSLLA